MMAQKSDEVRKKVNGVSANASRKTSLTFFFSA
jgi:hypothetical protein